MSQSGDGGVPEAPPEPDVAPAENLREWRWDVLTWHHMNARALLDEAVMRNADDAEIRRLAARERRYRRERHRRRQIREGPP